MKFYRKVGKSKKEMVKFLTEHFRYNTMNSWNQSTSYANNLKIHNVIPRGLQDTAYSLLEMDDAYDGIHFLIHDFAVDHEHRWQAGFNGRSGGYLVLYQGERKPSGYKSWCTACGQQNYTSIKENDKTCGRCGKKKRVDYTEPHMVSSTWPGRSTDQGEDFSGEEWDEDSLLERVKLVQDFDKLCDDIVAHFIYTCKNFKVVEKTIHVPKKIKVLQEF